MAKRPKKKKSRIARLFSFIFKVFIYAFLFSFLYILYGKWLNPPFTLTRLSAIFQGEGIHRDYISYDKMGDNIKLAVLAGEDQLFPDHNGFDFKSIQKALKHNRKSKSLRGASTISQQTAKNVFLWQHGGWFRKGLEVYFTFMIEKIWGKRRILDVYLNVAEMGPGVFGAEAASQFYFRKHANELTQAQAARIAACLPNPGVFTVKPMSVRVARRYPWIMKNMDFLKKDPDIQDLLK